MPINEAILTQIRSQAVAVEREHVQRLIASYRRVHDRLRGQADTLLAQLEAKRAKGQEIGKTEIRKMERYRYLMRSVEGEMQKFAAVIEAETQSGQVEMAHLATRQSAALVEASFSAVPPPVRADIMATFGVMPNEAVEALVEALQEDSALWTRTLSRYGAEAARGIGDTLVASVVAGKGPRATARDMRRAFGLPLSDALKISRTEHLRAHRLATLTSYRQNAHVVKGWIWHAELGPRTCMSCIAQHGSQFPLTETLDDHPNGRCAMVPVTVSFEELGLRGLPETRPDIENGEDWFGRQPEEVQRAMMGPGKFEAWQAGQFQFSQLTAERRDPDWGRTLGEASLKSILGAPSVVIRKAREPRLPPRIPVSHALELGKVPGMRSKIGKPVRDTIRIIDDVHGDGELSKIPVTIESGRVRLGGYYRRGSRPVKIGISRKSFAPHLDFAHEIGHFLDHEGIGKGAFASQSIADPFLADAPGLRGIKPLMDRIKASKAYKQLEGMKQAKPRQVESTLGHVITYKPDARYIEYLQSPQELFARAYSQWVAVRSKDRRLLGDLNQWRGRYKGLPFEYATQWTDRDFKPIGQAFDALFGALGWLR